MLHKRRMHRIGHTSIFKCLKFLAIGLWLVLACGCASSRSIASAKSAIVSVLDVQARAWNRGDVDGFMRHYWKSTRLTFSSGGTVTRGWQATIEGYRNRYPDRNAMGRLTFSELEVRPLGQHAALVLGRWHLDRDQPVGGIFSLVFQKKAGRWVIVHDHTSRDDG